MHLAQPYHLMGDYCLSKPKVTTDYSDDWGATRYFIGGKYFVLFIILEERPAMTVKLDPTKSKILRQSHTDIVPGYYANKTHWSTVYLDGEVSFDLITEMLDDAYQLVFKGLTKKVQQEILKD